MQTPIPFTCMKFFSNTTLIQSVLSGNWKTSYYDIRNYCLYCNQSTTEFQQAILSNTSVPYFWRHEQAVTCNGYPALMSNMQTNYFNWVKSSNSLLNGLSSGSLNDFLYFTKLRTTTSNFISEKSRNELFYTCMFLNLNMYGFIDDVWETVVLSIHGKSLWIVDLIVRTTIVIFMIILIWIPCIKY
jgi:hypothetical protein